MGLDLDDGASNFEIYNNISIGGVSMKLREGAHRKVYNNIWYMARSAPCFHVGNTSITIATQQHYSNGSWRYAMAPGWPWWPQMSYSVIAPPHWPWFEEIDRNCFYSSKVSFAPSWINFVQREERETRVVTTSRMAEPRIDRHSIFADPLSSILLIGTFACCRARRTCPWIYQFRMGKWGPTRSQHEQWPPNAQ